MTRIAFLSVAFVIAILALAFSVAGSNAYAAGNIGVSLDSGAIGTGDTLTVTYTMQRDYPAGELYIRDRNTNDQLYYQACPGTAGTHTTTWACNAPEGYYYVIIFGIVNDSYQEGNAAGFTVDNSPPATLASSPGGSGWRKNTVTLTARDTLSGVAATYYSLDNVTWLQCSNPDTDRITVPGGMQTIRFYAVDRAGNRENVKSVTYNVDDQPPATVASLSGMTGSGGWYTGEVQVTLGASDGASGVAGTYYMLNGLEYTYGGPFKLGTGSYWLTYWSRDNASNVESPHDMSISVDTDAPVTTASPPGNASRYINGIVTLTATGVSGVRGLYYSFDGNDWPACSSGDPGVGYVILPDGTHTLYYRAEGNNGLKESSRSATYNVDRRRPNITATLTGPQGDNGWYNGNVQVTLEASDGESGIAGISYEIDGSPHTYNGPFTIGDGIHSLTFRAADNAGNVNSSAIDGVKVDATPPGITCVLLGTASGQGAYASDVLATLEVSDSLAGVSHTEYSTDGSNWNSYAGPITVKKGGQATIFYRCTDNAGNTASGSKPVYFQQAGSGVPGDDQQGSGSTPAPTFTSAVSPSSTLKLTPKPTPSPSPTPTPKPSATPPAAITQEWTGLSWLLLLLATLALIAAGLVYAVYSRRKEKGRRRL